MSKANIETKIETEQFTKCIESQVPIDYFDKLVPFEKKQIIYSKYVNVKGQVYDSSVMKKILLKRNKSNLYDYDLIFSNICCNGQDDILKVFLSKEYEVKEDNLGLVFAAKNDHYKIVSMLLESKKFDPSIQNNAPIVNAVAHGSEKSFDLLLPELEDINFSASILMFIAIDSDQFTMIKKLHKAGCDVDEQSLCLATKKGYMKIIKYLIEECNAEVTDKVIKKARKYKRKNIVRYLIKKRD